MRVDPDGAVHVAAREIWCANGLAITADGKTLVAAESAAGRLAAFDVAGDGSLSRQRVFATLPQGAAPDGICVDAEDAVWVASPYINLVEPLLEMLGVPKPVEEQSYATFDELTAAYRGRLASIVRRETIEQNRQQIASDPRVQAYIMGWKAMFPGAIEIDVYKVL